MSISYDSYDITCMTYTYDLPPRAMRIEQAASLSGHVCEAYRTDTLGSPLRGELPRVTQQAVGVRALHLLSTRKAAGDVCRPACLASLTVHLPAYLSVHNISCFQLTAAYPSIDQFIHRSTYQWIDACMCLCRAETDCMLQWTMSSVIMSLDIIVTGKTRSQRLCF